MLHSMINQRLGRYTIHELLGRGGMAAVYRASDAALKRDVALKILYPQYSDDESLAERFKREAVLAASLEHPNIVPIYDVGEQDGMAYIAMKLLHGRPLVDLLSERGSLPIGELLPILEQIASALDYAHGKGVIHRDIKPGNIIIELPRNATPPPPAPPSSNTATGVGAPPALQGAVRGPLPSEARAVLTDFGIAKSLDAPGLTTTGAMLGTPDYMAPEQIAGSRIDRRADVYALGVLVYRALTGQRPFGGSTQDILMGHIRVMPEDPSFLNPQVAPALDPVIMRALAKKPDERFSSAGEFARALRAAAEGKRVPAPPPMFTPLAEQQTRMNTPRLATPAAQQPNPHTPVPSEVRARSVAPSRPITQPPVRRSGRSGPMIAALLLALLAALGVIGYGAARLLADRPPIPTPAPATATLPAIAIGGTATASATTEATAEATAEAATATGEALSPTAEQPTKTEVLPTATTRAATVPPPPPPLTRTPVPPTPTPIPPTSTVAPPTETPVPPTAVPPTSTPTEIACNLDLLRVGSGFRLLYESQIEIRGKIGCPAGNEQAINIADQVFQRGTMYWWQERDTIYALPESEGRNGRYESFPKQVAAGLPDPPEQIDPLMRREGGFARVYYAVEQVRAALGGPISPERGIGGAFQQFDNGFMIYSPNNPGVRGKTIYVLYNDGTFRRYDDLNLD